MKNREPIKFHSPAFGEMQLDERIAFQLRHAECHLGVSASGIGNEPQRHGDTENQFW